MKIRHFLLFGLILSISNISLAMDSKTSKRSALEIEKICEKTRQEFYRELEKDNNPKDNNPKVFLISIGSFVPQNDQAQVVEQQQPPFFTQAAKQYPLTNFKIILIDPFFCHENENIQRNKQKNLEIIKFPMCLFASYHKCFVGEPLITENDIFNRDVAEFVGYIQRILKSNGTIIIADIAHCIDNNIFKKVLSEKLTLTGELDTSLNSLPHKSCMKFATPSANFFCYDCFHLDENLATTLQILQTKNNLFKVFDPSCSYQKNTCLLF